MTSRRLYTANRRRLQRGLSGMVFACSALLVASCASAGGSPTAAETTNAPATPRPSAQAGLPEGAGVVLVDLDDAGEVATWTTLNDPVMGGKSTSRITSGDSGLVFSGDVSLENNGGFASARSPEDPAIGRRATGARSLSVRALGDGKTYLLKVGVAGQPWSYIQRFPTEAAVERSYELPIGGFEPVGMRLDPAPDAPQALDPSRIDQLSVYVLEQQGPFQLAIRAIDATA